MSIGEIAEVCAKYIAKECGLDFSVESLATVDVLLDEAKNWEQAGRDMFVLVMGCYVGEVLIGALGGHWCSDEDHASLLWNARVGIPAHSDRIKANPFVRCRKRLQNGEADGVAVWAKVLAAAVNKTQANTTDDLNEIAMWWRQYT